jgi:putative flippase GtrA
MGPSPSWPRQLVRFAAVGSASTGLFLVLYLILRIPFSPPVANVFGTVLTTLAGTMANGRLTFGVSGMIGARQHLKGLLITALGLAITTAAVAGLGTGGAVVECLVLIAASAAAGGVRFALYRHWVFRGAVGELA